MKTSLFFRTVLLALAVLIFLPFARIDTARAAENHTGAWGLIHAMGAQSPYDAFWLVTGDPTNPNPNVHNNLIYVDMDMQYNFPSYEGWESATWRPHSNFPTQRFPASLLGTDWSTTPMEGRYIQLRNLTLDRADLDAQNVQFRFSPIPPGPGTTTSLTLNNGSLTALNPPIFNVDANFTLTASGDSTLSNWGKGPVSPQTTLNVTPGSKLTFFRLGKFAGGTIATDSWYFNHPGNVATIDGGTLRLDQSYVTFGSMVVVPGEELGQMTFQNNALLEIVGEGGCLDSGNFNFLNSRLNLGSANRLKATDTVTLDSATLTTDEDSKLVTEVLDIYGNNSITLGKQTSRDYIVTTGAMVVRPDALLTLNGQDIGGLAVTFQLLYDPTGLGQQQGQIVIDDRAILVNSGALFDIRPNSPITINRTSDAVFGALVAENGGSVSLRAGAADPGQVTNHGEIIVGTDSTLQALGPVIIQGGSEGLLDIGSAGTLMIGNFGTALAATESLTTNNLVELDNFSTLQLTLDPMAGTSSQLRTGSTLSIGSLTDLNLALVNDQVLPLGTKFTLIEYGTLAGQHFNGYPNGSTFVLGQNHYQINYADSADPGYNGAITLAVVPTVPLTASLLPATQTVSGTVDTPLTQTATISPSGFDGTVTYSISPRLPNGLKFDNATGAIFGTPTAALTTTTFTIRGIGSVSGIATATVDLTINVASQTITFDPPPNLIYVPGGGFTVFASASSALPITYSSLTPAVCTASGNAIHILSADICTVAANQAGNANYDPAPQATQTITIGKATPRPLILTAAPISIAVNATSTLSTTGGSGTGTISYVVTGACSVAGNLVTGGPSAGNCMATATQAADANYLATTSNTVTVTVKERKTVTPIAGTGGTLQPATPQTVMEGSTATFTVTTEADYTIANVTGCGGTLTGTTYTTGPVNSDCTVNASFWFNPVTPTTYTVSPIAGAGGTLQPTPPQTVMEGSTATFTVTTEAGYTIANVTGCGGTLTGTTYTTGPINADCTVNASFRFNPVTPTVTLSANPSAPMVNQATTITATVTSPSGAPATPTGSVVISGSGQSCTATLSNGTGSCPLTYASAGSIDLISVYSGDANFVTASGTLTLSVGKIATTTILTSTPNPSTSRQAVTLTATVNSASGSPTATVIFRDGTAELGRASVSGGIATLTVSPLTIGSHDLSVAYTGDTTFAASNGTVTQTVTALEPVTVTTPGLPNGVIGIPYEITLGASGGEPPYAYTGSGFPVGLRLNLDGVLSGTPQQVGSTTVVITVTDAQGQTGQRVYTMTVETDLAVVTPSLIQGVKHAVYGQSLAAIGGTLPYAWSHLAGVLPDGLTLDPTSGLLSGIPTSLGTQTFTVQVTDDLGQTATQTLTLTIVNPSFTRDDAVNPTQPPITAALTLNPEAGTACDFNDENTFSLNLGEHGVPATSPVGFRFPHGLLQVVVEGCTSGATTLTLTLVYPRTLPPGTKFWKYGSTLTNPNPHWYVMDGAIIAGNTVTYTIRDGGLGDDDLKANGRIIDPAGPAFPDFTLTGELPTAVLVGMAYEGILTVHNGVGPYVWSVAAGTLPDGLTLIRSDPVQPEAFLSGTPTQIGDYAFTLQVVDEGQDNALAQQAFTVSITPEPSQVCVWGLGQDTDGDGVPDTTENDRDTDPQVKDNTVFDRPDAFVEQLYRDLLQREAYGTELAQWQSQLRIGISRGNVINQFYQLPEFQNGIGAITRLYHAAFNRTPDACGLAYWVDQWHHGNTLDHIAEFFVVSGEFLDQGLTDPMDFVTRLYENVLDRAPDPDGLMYWLGQLAEDATWGQVLLGFTQSPEYRVALDSRVTADLYYLGFLNRVPDVSGYAFWVNDLDQTDDPSSVHEAVQAMPEYHYRVLGVAGVARQGLDKGEKSH